MPLTSNMFSMFEGQREVDPQPPDARWLVLFVCSLVLIVFVVIPNFPAVTLFAVLFLWHVGRRAAEDLRNSRRYEALTQSIVGDERAPVLYLRAFITDGSMPKRLGDGFYMFLAMFIGPFATLFALRPDRSSEELLSASLSRIGPVVALAKPGEDLPELGARRLEVVGEWQLKVEVLIKACSLIVFNGSESSASQGLWWELRRAVELVPLSRIVIFLPLEPLDKKYPEVRETRYQYLRNRAEPIIGRQLPSVIGKNQYICFDSASSRPAKDIDAALATIELSRRGRPTQTLERTTDAAAQR